MIFYGGIMIKGVNKKIIEINNPDSLYFEKAILYVRPNVTILPDAVSQKEAERILNGLIRTKKRSGNFKKFIPHAFALMLIIALFLIFLG